VNRLDRALHDGGAARVAVAVGHERAVEFHVVDGQGMQIGQARIARAVVVHGQPDTHGAQLGQDVRRAGGVTHEDLLGDLQVQRGRRYAVAGQHVGNIAGSAVSCRLEADRFTATTRSRPSARQARHCSMAISRTCVVSWPINPARSARDRNTSG
jgi:hypothetical protein